MVHTARRDHSDGGRLSTPAQLTRSRGSAWFIGLTTLTLGLYVYFGVLVVIDAGAEASEAAHLVGAIGCTAIVAAGLLPQLFAPTRNVAALQQAFVHGRGPDGGRRQLWGPDNQGGQNGPFDMTYLIFLVPLLLLAVLHPARRELVRPGQVRPLLLLVAAAVAVPPVRLWGPPRADSAKQLAPKRRPHHNSHWFMMAEFGFAIPLVAAVGGLGGRGWRVPTWTAPAVLAALGAVSVLFRQAPSSLGMRWGALAVLTAIVYSVLSVVEIRPRRLQRTRTGAAYPYGSGKTR